MHTLSIFGRDLLFRPWPLLSNATPTKPVVSYEVTMTSLQTSGILQDTIEVTRSGTKVPYYVELSKYRQDGVASHWLTRSRTCIEAALTPMNKRWCEPAGCCQMYSACFPDRMAGDLPRDKSGFTTTLLGRDKHPTPAFLFCTLW